MDEGEEIKYIPWTAKDCIGYNCTYCIKQRADEMGNIRCRCLNKDLKGLLFKGECKRKKKHFGDKHNVSIPNLEK